MLCNECKQVITTEKECNCLNKEQWLIVREIKNNYKQNSKYPTLRGLALHIWKELLLIKQDNKELTMENNHLWSVRAKDIATAVTKYSAKMNKEITSLKNEIIQLENINKNLMNLVTKQCIDTDSKKKDNTYCSICSQCGGSHTCYCK